MSFIRRVPTQTDIFFWVAIISLYKFHNIPDEWPQIVVYNYVVISYEIEKLKEREKERGDSTIGNIS